MYWSWWHYGELHSPSKGGTKVHGGDMYQCGSQALIIVLAGTCTLLFWRANRRQRKGKGLIESVGESNIRIK